MCVLSWNGIFEFPGWIEPASLLIGPWREDEEKKREIKTHTSVEKKEKGNRIFFLIQT